MWKSSFKPILLIRNASPTEPIDPLRVLLEKQSPHSASWLRSLFEKCGVCATGSLATHIVTCFVLPTGMVTAVTSAATWAPNTVAALVSPETAALIVGHNPWVMTEMAAAGNAIVLAGWYAVRGRGVNNAVKFINAGVVMLGLTGTAAYNLVPAYVEAHQYLVRSAPEDQRAFSELAQISNYWFTESYLIDNGICGDKSGAETIQALIQLRGVVEAIKKQQSGLGANVGVAPTPPTELNKDGNLVRRRKEIKPPTL